MDGVLQFNVFWVGLSSIDYYIFTEKPFNVYIMNNPFIYLSTDLSKKSK